MLMVVVCVLLCVVAVSYCLRHSPLWLGFVTAVVVCRCWCLLVIVVVWWCCLLVLLFKAVWCVRGCRLLLFVVCCCLLFVVSCVLFDVCCVLCRSLFVVVCC